MKNNKIDKIDAKMWKGLLQILLKQKKYLIKVFIPLLIVATLDITFPIMNSYALDYLAVSSPTKFEFYGFILLYVIFIIGFGVFVFTYLHFTGVVEYNFAYDLRKATFEKVQQLSFSYFDQNPDGWIISRLTSDISRITEILSWGLMDSVFGLISIIGISIVMLISNFKLALLILSVTPILIYVSIFFQKRILREQRKARKHNSEVTAAIAESINGAKTIKSLRIEDYIKDDFDIVSSKMRRSAKHANLYSAMFIPIVIFLGGVASSMIIYYGGNEVINKVMPFGMLMMFTSYTNLFFQPLREIARLIAELQMAQASAERVLQLINTQNDVKDSEEVISEYGTILKPKVENYPAMFGDVEFKNINFNYTENEVVLENFNLKVNQGESIALVGETGSGKSTIINLLCRFYEPVSGEILIDDINYQSRSLGWLRANIGYVLQSPHLFSGSIKDNIKYGKLDATDEEIIDAAKKVNAHEFIMNMRDGYDSDVGENGSRLSLGQKQLVSFARAIVKEPTIFILDEATASIDSETEMIVQNAIDEILKDKTSFIVAHRLSTIINCDKIIVIKDGKIVESGKHNELIKLGGYYYRLYTNQFKKDSSEKILSKM